MELAGIAGSVEDFCERVRSGLAGASFEQRRKLVELLIDRVIVTDEEVEIRYVIPTDPSSEQVRFCHLRSDYLGGSPLVMSVNLSARQLRYPRLAQTLKASGADPNGMELEITESVALYKLAPCRGWLKGR